VHVIITYILVDTMPGVSCHGNTGCNCHLNQLQTAWVRTYSW